MIQYALSSQSIKLKEMIAMGDKSLTDLKTFVENINKKNKKHSGKKIRFHFVKKKRK